MSKEIERKFLVLSDEFRALAVPEQYIQGYLGLEKGRIIRVRIAGEKAYLTVKGAMKGLVRTEFEYPIPVQDAVEMLENLCIKPLIRKWRYKIPYQGFLWEVDVFEEENQGLVVAEVELPEPDCPFDKPTWVGEEVSFDPKYGNGSLVFRPFNSW